MSLNLIYFDNEQSVLLMLENYGSKTNKFEYHIKLGHYQQY